MPRTGCSDPWLSGAGARHHWAWISSPGLASLRLHACAGVPCMGASRAMLVCPEFGRWKGGPSASRGCGGRTCRRRGMPCGRPAASGARRRGAAADMARALLDIADLARDPDDPAGDVSEELAHVATRRMLNFLEDGAALLERCPAQTERERAAFLIGRLAGRRAALGGRACRADRRILPRLPPPPAAQSREHSWRRERGSLTAATQWRLARPLCAAPRPVLRSLPPCTLQPQARRKAPAGAFPSWLRGRQTSLSCAQGSAPSCGGAGSCRSAPPGTLSTTWAARGGARAAARPARRGLQAAPGRRRLRGCAPAWEQQGRAPVVAAPAAGLPPSARHCAMRQCRPAALRGRTPLGPGWATLPAHAPLPPQERRPARRRPRREPQCGGRLPACLPGIESRPLGARSDGPPAAGCEEAGNSVHLYTMPAQAC